MRYAVLSDSHDNTKNLEKALEIVQEREITQCFHLGDFCRPATIEKMLSYKNLTWICVWGNMDTEAAMAYVIEKRPATFDIAGDESRVVEAGGRKVFLSHFPRNSRPAAESGKYDAAFHGHTHKRYTKKLSDGTLLANPGEIEGSRTGTPSLGVWDSETNEMEIIEIKKFSFNPDE